ncbi:uncharacterized protein LOC111696503 [Eurytemora carolleeae]|uniref:uncharacterized protein LOC111696503 n=1 Tax=Eurytemora carolleeae TaxID=1294199 RepID=UPI000C75B64F|nr:uncharacterized protein LOC111696503 [Eurytemora carolleeae]|eukprot:XP_023321882.1 uncharacterized protein LOC111696503 [Eurytemora affinis]
MAIRTQFISSWRMNTSFLLIFCIQIFQISSFPSGDVKTENAGDTKSMLDAMVQLLTGSNDGFNETYFEELVQCMDDYDLNLYTSQDAAWAGMIAYSDSNGTPEDEWGGCLDTGHCHKYHEQNATTQSRSVKYQNFHNITIYEPCNYASNVAYYHVVTQICQHKDLWSMPKENVRALLQGFATLTMGSSFWHGSHTYLGNVADNRFIDIVSYVAHQAMVDNLPTESSIVKELSLTSRSGSAVQATQGLTELFITTPVENWTQAILDLDVPDYYLTFSGLVCTFFTLLLDDTLADILIPELMNLFNLCLVCTFFTLLLDDTLADILIPELMNLFNLPEEQREFIFNFYLPEIRNATSHIELNEVEKGELQGNIASTMIKLIYAFLWQEYVISESAFFLNPVTNVVGSTMIKYVNRYANSLSTFPIYDQEMQDGGDVYPGSDRCNPQEPHSKWHLESANGLLDLIFLADYINLLTA